MWHPALNSHRARTGANNSDQVFQWVIWWELCPIFKWNHWRLQLPGTSCLSKCITLTSFIPSRAQSLCLCFLEAFSWRRLKSGVTRRSTLLSVIPQTQQSLFVWLHKAKRSSPSSQSGNLSAWFYIKADLSSKEVNVSGGNCSKEGKCWQNVLVLI